jgi:hypothetical protein
LLRLSLGKKLSWEEAPREKELPERRKQSMGVGNSPAAPGYVPDSSLGIA